MTRLRPGVHTTMKSPTLAICVLTLVSSSGGRAIAADDQTVEIHFRATVGPEAAGCSKTYQHVGKTGADLFLQDFRIYVSAIRLLKKDGAEVPLALTNDGVWQSDQLALLDFENGSGNCNGNAPTNDVVGGTVPRDEYVGLVFEIGVPFEVNHQDPTLAAAPLNYSALTWPWSIGYKFATIDFDTKSPGDRKMVDDGMGAKMSATGFSVHLGSTGCASKGPRIPPRAPCANPNRPTYRFEHFDAAKQAVVLDLGELLAGTDITVNAPKSASGCMSFPKDNDCIDIMNRFGLAYSGKPSSGQRFVRIQPL